MVVLSDIANSFLKTMYRASRGARQRINRLIIGKIQAFLRFQR